MLSRQNSLKLAVNSKMNVVLRLIPMACVMGIIFLLSHQPGDSFSLPLFSGFDKLGHMAVYSMLAGATLFAFNSQIRQKSPYIVVCLTVIFCLGYGLSDEFHQSFVVGRFASGGDVVADTMGALMTSTLWLMYRKYGRKRIT